MTVFLVAYDMNKERKGWDNDRDKLREAIKGYGTWAYLSESAYAIETDQTARQVFTALSKHIDENDTLLVITLTAKWDGRASKKVIDWLTKKLGY